MNTQTKSPRITRYAWGSIEVDGKHFRDAKCYPGGAKEWNWKETGTNHKPGIQPEDVQELIRHGAKVVVLSQGVYERLQVCKETMRLLNQNNIKIYILQTDEAVDIYNKLQQTDPVGGLFHTTC